MPVTPGCPAGCSAQALERVVGAGCELFYLVIRHKQQTPSMRICACSRRGRLRGRPPGRPRGQTTISSRQAAREIDSQSSITSDPDLMRPPRSLHPMLTKAPHRLTHTMAYAVIEYLGIAVEPAGSAIALCHGTEQVSHYSNWTPESSGESKASTSHPQW